jgi:hypothetical protein
MVEQATLRATATTDGTTPVLPDGGARLGRGGDELGDPVRPDRVHGGAHRGATDEPIVHQDHRSSGGWQRVATITVEPLAALELDLLLSDD